MKVDSKMLYGNLEYKQLGSQSIRKTVHTMAFARPFKSGMREVIESIRQS